MQSTGEPFITPLAFPVLNVVVNTAFTITDDSVQQVIDDPEILTPGIGAGVALGCEMFGATAGAFPLGVGNDIRFRLQDCQFNS
jgi:hypothetical protein